MKHSRFHWAKLSLAVIAIIIMAGLLLGHAATAAAAQTRTCGSNLVVKTTSSSALIHYAAKELESYALRLFGVPAGTATTIVLSSRQAQSPGLEAVDSYEIRPTLDGVEVIAANDRAALYGAYELVRGWGVQFYLGGDVLPARPQCVLPALPVRREAVMKLRGVHPYPDFLSGPTSWDEQQYELYLRQLPKLGLNFFGIHQYTYEPYVDYEVDGVHPRNGHLETTATREWGYGNQSTCEFEVGRELFPSSCVWGARAALEPRTPEERYRAAEKLMSFALGRAHELGLVTAFGFEPMVNDPEFTELAKTPAGARRVVQARISATLRAFPKLDYVWLFADEANQRDEKILNQTYQLIQEAERLLKQKAPGKRLMVGGWNVEPTLRKMDDGFGPETVFTSYGNYDPWRTVNERRHELFRGLTRPHAIAAWCEYDGRLLTGLQPNVTAYQPMHRAILDSGSVGFYFLHWNTRACDSNLDYLAKMAWRSRPANPRDYYQEYLRERFALADGPILDSVVAATLELEAVNKLLAESGGAIWLMGDDWTVLGPWKLAADSVQSLMEGKVFSEITRKELKYQVKRAGEVRAKVTGRLPGVIAAYDALAQAAGTGKGTAAFLANRTRFFVGYLQEYLKLSLAVEHLLKAEDRVRRGADPRAELRSFRDALNVETWVGLVRLYTQDLDDRGELGIVVSLNQKILAGLRLLEKNLISATR